MHNPILTKDERFTFRDALLLPLSVPVAVIFGTAMYLGLWWQWRRGR